MAVWPKEVMLTVDLQRILEVAISAKASDIHIAVGVPPIVRVNGRLLHMGEKIMTPEMTEQFARQILSDKMWQTYRASGECDASFSYQDKMYFRVNVFQERNQCSVVLRLIPSQILTLEQLELPQVLRNLCMKRRGLILVTGPTGSGKTTTLAAMIEYMSRVRNEHIITIEDPIEYVFSHGAGIVHQRQLGSDTQSFASAIRSALREDPDIIMVGEMRDLETISAAITAAETGHLVLSTLHTIGAAKTIDRIIDVFPGNQQSQIRSQLSAVLEAVISQQLVPNRDNSRRLLAMEIMLASHAILNLIQEKKTNQIQNIIQIESRQGMVTMDQSLLRLYKNGLTDEKTVLKFCVDHADMRKQLGMS